MPFVEPVFASEGVASATAFALADRVTPGLLAECDALLPLADVPVASADSLDVFVDSSIADADARIARIARTTVRLADAALVFIDTQRCFHLAVTSERRRAIGKSGHFGRWLRAALTPRVDARE